MGLTSFLKKTISKTPKWLLPLDPIAQRAVSDFSKAALLPPEEAPTTSTTTTIDPAVQAAADAAEARRRQIEQERKRKGRALSLIHI